METLHKISRGVFLSASWVLRVHNILHKVHVLFKILASYIVVAAFLMYNGISMSKLFFSSDYQKTALGYGIGCAMQFWMIQLLWIDFVNFKERYTNKVASCCLNVTAAFYALGTIVSFLTFLIEMLDSTDSVLEALH